jgi:fructose/tagatose bisphosphate aldolase
MDNLNGCDTIGLKLCSNTPEKEKQMSAKVNVREIETLVREMVFTENKSKQLEVREMAQASGIFPASIQNLYEAIGKGLYSGFSVPAMNIRGITFDVARAAFRAAIKNKVGAFVFELARSEMSYTFQTPGEYAAVVMAAALAEGYQGPVFIQGDHMQIRRKNYAADPQKEQDFMRSLIKDCVEAGFYNIDIDASTLVDIDMSELLVQQEANGLVTAEMTKFVRGIEPKGVTISVGGEIGEIGSGNSTVEDLKAFMAVYRKYLGQNMKGISKISVQTGTTHGGVALPDGTIAKVQLDFSTLEKMSKMARAEYGMGGAVQHGASTLPDEMFDLFPKVGTLEVHLATGFQNIILDSLNFPQPLLTEIQAGLEAKYAAERKPGETDAQFFYSTRKRAFGDFKQKIWDIAPEKLQKIGQELEERFTLLYRKLNVVDTRAIVDKVIKPL